MSCAEGSGAACDHWQVSRLLAALRSPAGLFLASRAAVWLLVVFLLATLNPRAPGGNLWDDRWLHDVGRYLDVWGRWDGSWYARIASDGYRTAPSAPAFHPLYPVIVSGVGRVLGEHYLVAGVLVSLTAGTAAFVLLQRLALRHIDAPTTRRALLYVAIFPTSIFLQAVYTESLYLLLAVATFLLAERGRFAAAALVCGLAILTRPSAIALLPPLALLAWRARDRWHALGKIAIAPALFLLYPAVLWIQLGDPLSSLHAQRAWNRTLSATGPYEAVRAPVEDLMHGRRSDAAINLEALAYLVFFLALAVLAWRLFGAAYGLFAVGSLLVPLANPGQRWPLMSLPRFALVVFPIFFALATIARSPRRHGLVVAVFALLLVGTTVRWTLYHWVA
jgi:hypothetical protein